MLKKLGHWTATLALLGGMFLVAGCADDDITAPEQKLDSSGNPVGTADMMKKDAADDKAEEKSADDTEATKTDESTESGEGK